MPRARTYARNPSNFYHPSIYVPSFISSPRISCLLAPSSSLPVCHAMLATSSSAVGAMRMVTSPSTTIHAALQSGRRAAAAVRARQGDDSQHGRRLPRRTSRCPHLSPPSLSPSSLDFSSTVPFTTSWTIKFIGTSLCLHKSIAG